MSTSFPDDVDPNLSTSLHPSSELAEISLLRSHIYNLYSQLVRSPIECAGKVPFGWEQESLQVLKASRDTLELDLDGLEELVITHRETLPEEMQKNYRELFGDDERDLGIPIEEEVGQAIPVGTKNEIKRIYDYFGYRPFEYGGRSADHLSVELGFMKVISLREALSDRESAFSYAMVQRDFLERHMLRWFPSAADQVMETRHDDFYPRLFEKLATFLVQDAKWRRESVDKLKAA
jgi:TorA maturation chaperone TorD